MNWLQKRTVPSDTGPSNALLESEKGHCGKGALILALKPWPAPRSVPNSSQEHWDHSEKWLLLFSEGPVLLWHTACTRFCWSDSFMRTDPVILGPGAAYRLIVIMKTATPKPRAAVVRAQGPYGCSCDRADAWWIWDQFLSDLRERSTFWQPAWLCGKSHRGHSAPVPLDILLQASLSSSDKWEWLPFLHEAVLSTK